MAKKAEKWELVSWEMFYDMARQLAFIIQDENGIDLTSGFNVYIDDQKLTTEELNVPDTVQNANAVTLVYAAATSYVDCQDVSGNPLKKVNDYLADLRDKSFAQLYQRHVNDYAKLFGRVSIDLGGRGANENLPTDQRPI